MVNEGEDKCCWTNPNACCEPPTPAKGEELACAEVITTCCKTKYYDEGTKTYKYKYSFHISKEIKIIVIINYKNN